HPLFNSFPTQRSSDLHAVHWPKHLRQAVEINHLSDALSGMIGRERSMIRRMPILRRHDQLEAIHQRIGDRHDLISLAHCQRPARSEEHTSELQSLAYL